MKLRNRIITLLAVSLVATMLAPLGAQAARATNPATAPFSQTFVQDYCGGQGTGTCTSEATADRSGRLTGVSTSYAKSDSAQGVTGTSYAFSRGGVLVSFNLPKSGASSVTFTVDTHVNSASATTSNPLQPAWADVYFFAYGSNASGNCTSCTVIHEETVADTDDSTPAPATRSNEDQSFTFVLKSGAGDRLKGRVEVYLWLTEFSAIGWYSDENLLPMGQVPVEGTAEARGDAVIKSVTAAFTA